ncbi:MAG TPA: TetR family transcriptional regulator [Solirubrobacteraceae bacterium]|nr:TetR family transcriptional regulator [Solirubrobacteraceae bacterium]
MADLQRLRIVSGMLDVACERGAANTTIAQVVERSGVSRRTFYELFADRDECFLAAFDQALVYAADRVVPAYESQKSWRKAVRAGLVAMLALFDDEPRLAQVLVCESLSGGRPVLARRSELLEQLTQIVEGGRVRAQRSAASLPLLGEGVLGGVLMVLQRHVSQAGEGSMLELTNSLMSMIVLPYLGPTAARRELGLPVESPVFGMSRGPLARDPFKVAGMRLTYRTMRVLMAIGERDGVSNRVIGRAAGIEDQGQASKLLARLQRLGLIENTYDKSGQGAPNSWVLTKEGRRMTDGIVLHADSGNADQWLSTRRQGRR